MGHPTGIRVLQDPSLKRAGVSVCHAQAGDIRTIQELLDYRDVSTMVIYTHLLNRGGLGINNPADRL
jgi:hypothetical protein